MYSFSTHLSFPGLDDRRIYSIRCITCDMRYAVVSALAWPPIKEATSSIINHLYASIILL